MKLVGALIVIEPPFLSSVLRPRIDRSSAPKTCLTENMNNKNSVKWNNDVQPKEFTASRINQITWDDASGRLKITLDGKTIAYIPVVYN